MFLKRHRSHLTTDPWLIRSGIIMCRLFFSFRCAVSLMNAYQILCCFVGVFNFSEKLAPRQKNRSTTRSSTPPWSNIFWKLCSCFNIENNNKPKSKTKLNSQLILRVLNKSHEATEVLVYFFSNPTDLGRRSFLRANFSSPFFSFFHFSSLSRSACLENPVRSNNLAVFDDVIKKRIVLEVTKNDRWYSQLNRIYNWI